MLELSLCKESKMGNVTRYTFHVQSPKGLAQRHGGKGGKGKEDRWIVLESQGHMREEQESVWAPAGGGSDDEKTRGEC